MYTPEEIQEIFDRYHDATRAGIPISEALAREMADATKGVKNYTYELNRSLKYLGTQTKAVAQDLANGAKGASVFNNQIDAAGGVAANVASQFGLLGKGLGLAIQALTAWITAVNKQSDALYGNFQQLSRSGAVGAQGMDDVFQSMQRMGYTIDELDKMSAVLIENSKDFALFSGTAATGSKQLADLVMGMEDARVQFFNLGMNVDDISRATAGYRNQLARNGRLQEATSAGAKAYIKEMETLTRLTGLQRKEIEEQRQAAEDIDQFYASLMEMDPKAAQNAYSVFTQLMAVDPSGKKARAFAVSMDGIIGGSADQMESLYSTNFEMLEFAQALKQGRIDASQYMQAESDARSQTIGLQKELAKVGVTDMFGGLKNNVLQVNKGLTPFAKQLGLSEKEVEDLMNGVNGATAAQSDMRNSQIKASQAMQEFINAGINPVTKAMKILANAVEYLTDLLPFSGSAKAKYEREQQEAASSAAAKVTGGVIDKIIQAESGGRNIGNIGGASSAFGVGQITKGTFEGLAKQATPGSALHGKTFEDMKASVDLQREALSQLTTQNQAALAKKGFEATDASTYLAHFLGAPTAIRVLQAPDNTPIRNAVESSQIAANPNVFKDVATVGDLKAWANRKMGGTTATAQAAKPVDANKPTTATAQAANPVDANKPTTTATAGPSGVFGWKGRISGPMSGYRPNVLMHGEEDLEIKPAKGSSSTFESQSLSNEMASKLIERVDDLIQISRNQLGVNEKMLRYQA